MSSTTQIHRSTQAEGISDGISREVAGGQNADGSASAPRIRVAYIVHTFHVGGLERCVARLASQLDRKRFDPLVICLNRSDDARQWISSGDVRILEIGKRPGNDPRAVWRLARMLRREKVEIIHSHNWGTLVESAVARRLGGVPIHVHAERGMELEDIRCSGWRSAARDRVKSRAMRSANAVISVSESIRQHLAERNIISAENVEVIPNGVEPAMVDSTGARERIRARLRINDNSVLIGSVGRLAAVKDFASVIRAVHEIVGRGRDVHLVLVGGGVEREHLNSLRRELRFESRCHLVGQQSDVGNWLSAMDIYVNCSVNEGMSQSVLEAMAAAKPLVVTNVGDSARLVGGEVPCGVVVAASDTGALADGLDALVLDPRQRELLAERAEARHRKQYSSPIMIDRYEEFYSSLIMKQSHSAKGTQER